MVDTKHVQRAVTLISDALSELTTLRSRRSGNRSAAELRDELVAINKGIARGNGLLLREKLHWFDHESVRNELGNLKAMMQAVRPLVDDAGVQGELVREGFSVPKTVQHVENALDAIEHFRSVVDRHERMTRQAVQGEPFSSEDLALLEDRMLRLNEWEERIAELGQSAIARIAQSRAPDSRIAAALLLPLASAAAVLQKP